MNALKPQTSGANDQPNGKIEVEKTKVEEKVEESTKAQSVLQTKLTTLAIHIGYAGMGLFLFSFIS
jgi:hypothetical protein